jgi:6-phosphogluconate dehydrogenase
MEKADIGLVGLAVMGQNLVLNIERNGYCVAVYNRTTATMREFVDAHPGRDLVACETLEELVASLEAPRKILLMVKAGSPVDAVIEQIRPLLEPGDLLIDGGNSHFKDTERRSAELEADGILYIGTGVSGGEEGALWGPSIMPGGQRPAWEMIQPIFEAIAARADDGEPCVSYIGPRGSGHYVKMVHNGIEYGDMQLIAEAYDFLHRGLALSADELHEVFAEWNEQELESYLIEITAGIFARLDDETGKPLLDLILDEAQQKGTGKWTSQDALDLGAPIPTINSAVVSRIISAFKGERTAASELISGPEILFEGERAAMIANVGHALYAAKICSYAQGFALLRAASAEYDYRLDYGELARIWRAGCIIRARLLEDIREAFAQNSKLTNLLLDPAFRQAVESRQMALRRVVQAAIGMGIPVSALSASLAYFDAYRTARLPANLTQAQRDYFGAHTYRRIDREGAFHTDWKR